MRAYRVVDGFAGGGIIISDGADICVTPTEAREMAAELIEAADRADRGDLDYFSGGKWRRK